MRNYLTKEEIKKSIEYRWRKTSLFWLLGIWVITTVVMFFALVLSSLGEMKYIKYSEGWKFIIISWIFH